MSDTMFDPVRERLKVEAGRSAQHGWVVRRVRKILWPFIRSYHFFGIDHTERRIVEVETLIEQKIQAQEGRFNALSAEAYDQTRAARAEALSASRLSTELREDSQQAKRLTEHLVQELEKAKNEHSEFKNSLLKVVNDLEDRLAAIKDQQLPSRNTDFNLIPGQLGWAICVNTDYGPLIMKPGDLITNHVIINGSWDAHIIEVAKQARSRGSTAIDIGAHFGTLTCALSQIFNKVQAFEANKDSVRYLYANAALRQSGAIEVHHIGIYSKEELLSFASKEEQEVEINRDANEEDYYNSSNSGGLMFVTQGTGVNAIRAVPLDSYQFKDVGFIKIDCQGADGEVIKGALTTISSCKPFIVFEWEDKLAQSHQVSLLETMNSLKNLGYIINELYRHNEKQIDYVAIPPKE